ncbi:clostripain-related cysteine peptidase [Reichenbachiella sp.]|uniref:clostripain-related cysteine peptidase n=1 Tax=Reichenbachiella sp. TaxID=2184521 RepID=UPI003B5AC934
MPTEKEWAILFLVQIRNTEDHDCFLPILNDLKNIPLGEQSEVILCINFKPIFRSSFITLNPSSVSYSGLRKQSNCIFRLVLNSSPLQVSDLELIEEFEDFDITSSHDVGKLFIRKMKNRFPAKRHMLFTWDHGNGYSMFKTHQSGYNSRLTMRKLNRAIEIGLQGKKRMDVVIMMNCWMQLIDTIYALKYSVAHLVAFQDPVDMNIHSIGNVIKKMIQMPEVSSKNLSRGFVEATKNFANHNHKKVSVSAFDLTLLGDFFDQLDCLSMALKKEIEINAENTNKDRLIAISDAFALSHVLDTGKRYIDFFSLITNLKTTLQTKEALICNGLLFRYDKMLSSYYTNYPKKDKNDWDKPHGMNICSPFTILPQIKSRDWFELERVENIKATEFSHTAWGRLSRILSLLDFKLMTGQLD